MGIIGRNETITPFQIPGIDVMPNNSCIDINDYLSEQSFDWTSLTGVRVLIGIIYSIIFCVGFFGNTGVMIKVASNKKLQSARNIFLLNLMASDFLLCLTAVPFTPVSVITKRWIFGAAICKLIPLCQSMSVIITSLSLTAIAVDKYVHIMDVTKLPVSITQASIVVAVIWLVAGGLNLPLVLSYDVFDGAQFKHEYGVAFCGEFCDEVHWSSVACKKAYGTTIMCIQFIVPMVIIVFCYARIMNKVRADMMVDNKQFSTSLSGIQRLDAIRKKRRVNYILIMMVVAFVGSWFPLTLFNILRDYSLLPEFISYQPFMWALIVHSTAMTTVIWNPLLFFWLTARTKRDRRRQNEGVLLTFMLASNPARMLFNRRSKRRREKTSYYGTDEETTYEPTCTEFSTAAVAYAAVNTVIYRGNNLFKKKISTNSTTPILRRKYTEINEEKTAASLRKKKLTRSLTVNSARFRDASPNIPLLGTKLVKAESICDLRNGKLL